jgi:hypothetical protein
MGRCPAEDDSEWQDAPNAPPTIRLLPLFAVNRQQRRGLRAGPVTHGRALSAVDVSYSCSVTLGLSSDDGESIVEL